MGASVVPSESVAVSSAGIVLESGDVAEVSSWPDASRPEEVPVVVGSLAVVPVDGDDELVTELDSVEDVLVTPLDVGDAGVTVFPLEVGAGAAEVDVGALAPLVVFGAGLEALGPSAPQLVISATPKPSRTPLMIGWRIAGR